MVCAEYDAGGAYLQHIEAAARAAAAAALQLLLRDCGLLARLAALRAHFMMARGDCALYLMDIAEEELKKTAGQVSITRLQSLLELGARLQCHTSHSYALYHNYGMSLKEMATYHQTQGSLLHAVDHTYPQHPVVRHLCA